MIEELIEANNNLNKSVAALKSRMARFINSTTDYGKQKMVLNAFVLTKEYGGLIDIQPVDYGESITINTENDIITLNQLKSIDTLKELAMALVAKDYELV